MTMTTRTLLAILTSWGFLMGSTALAQEPASRLIPRDTIFGNPDKASPSLSPDGRFLSYLAPVDGVLNVWVGPVNQPDEAKPVTKDTKRGIQTYLWAHTNEHVLYLQDSDGDENYHVYSVYLPSGEIKDLTPIEGVRAQLNEVSHRIPGEILVGLNDRSPQYHDLYRIDITTGEKEKVQENKGFLGFVTDDDFKVRLSMKFGPDGGTIVSKPDGKDGWETFTEIPMEDSLTTQPLFFDKAGKTLYSLDSRGRDTAALVAIDLETGTTKVLGENKKADAEQVLVHPTENTIQGVAFNRLRKEYQFFDKDIEADFDRLKKVADGDISISSRTSDDRRWIVSFLMDNGPTRYYLYDRDTQKSTFLFTNNAKLEKWTLPRMHPLEIKSRDGLDLVSYLSLPTKSDPKNTGRPSEPIPMVLLVHGGPWARDRWGANSLHHFLADRGYAVLSVNYRGSTGFGKAFINAGNQEWAGKMHDDLIDAVKWAVDEKIADPKKVAIMGGSYGGYATLVGLTFTPEVFTCGVDIVGPSNILTLLTTIPPYWAPAIEMFKKRVGDFTSEEGQTMLKERSPLTHVERIQRPLLIGQGANDPRVKQSESDQIVEAMQEKMIPVTYVLFPDEGHGFARPENRLAFYAISEAFLAEHLGGQFEPIGEAFEGSSVKVLTGVDDVPGLEAKVPKPE